MVNGSSIKSNAVDFFFKSCGLFTIYQLISTVHLAQFHSLRFLGLCLKQDYVQESFSNFLFFTIKTNLEFLFFGHRDRIKTKDLIRFYFLCVFRIKGIFLRVCVRPKIRI